MRININRRLRRLSPDSFIDIILTLYFATVVCELLSPAKPAKRHKLSPSVLPGGAVSFFFPREQQGPQVGPLSQ